MVAISASLIGTGYPQTVQLVVTGMTIGDTFSITGQGAGATWTVRAGEGVAEASQVVRNDAASPINVMVNYLVAVNGVTAASTGIVVPYTGGNYVFQSLDGKRSAGVYLLENGLPRDLVTRVDTFRIPGRTGPVTMYDVAAGEAGTFAVQTTDAQTADLKALLTAGAPVLWRSNGSIRDLPAVEVLHVVSAPSAATWRTIDGGTGRNWTLGYEVIDDPEPDTVVATSTWDDFDAVYAGMTWADFDAEWAGQTWDQFDLEDWSTRA